MPPAAGAANAPFAAPFAGPPSLGTPPAGMLRPCQNSAPPEPRPSPSPMPSMGRRTARRWSCCTASPTTPRSYDEVVPPLVAAGCRVHRALSARLRADPLPVRRNAALGPAGGARPRPAASFMDALAIPRAALAGYDWGGRAACVVAALWPERVRGLVSCTGYNIQDIAASVEPGAAGAGAPPLVPVLFPHRARPGRAGREPRATSCRLLWRLWSPNWAVRRRHLRAQRRGLRQPGFRGRGRSSPTATASATPPATRRLEAIEAALAAQPTIAVPTIVLHGAGDGVGAGPKSGRPCALFHRALQRRVIPLVGHNVPQEAPEAFARCILDLPPTQ